MKNLYPVLLAAALILFLADGLDAAPAALAQRSEKATRHGTLKVLNGCRVLSVWGTPEQMGTAHGTLLKATIKKVIRDVITEGLGSEKAAYENMLRGSAIMQKHQPREYIRELKSLAAAAEVKYEDLLLLQYFGDVRRCIQGAGASSLCTSFAVLPPLTRGKTCIVGRNFDYFDNGVGRYASLLVHYRPKGKTPFVTVTWAGIINGWTILSQKGIVVSNNTSFDGRSRSLEAISTCFLLRHIAENAGSVAEGIRLIKAAKRSCGTSVLIASGKPPNAAIVEFDAEGLAVRSAENGFVSADNGFLKLYSQNVTAYYGRSLRALNIARGNRGKVDLKLNIAGSDGVPIESMNLHSAMIDCGSLRLRIAMGSIPAFKRPFKAFRLTPDGLVEDKQ